MTTKEPIIIDNVPYYACATTAQAATLGKKGSGTTQLCTADDVLKGTYGVTFVENTKVSYAQNQAVAYVDLEKDTLPENIEGEVNLELAGVSCGVAMAEEQWEKQTVTKTETATGSTTVTWNGRTGSSFEAWPYTNTINANRTIQYANISLNWTSSPYEGVNSSHLTTTKVVEYRTLGSDDTWGKYQTLSANLTTTRPTQIRIKVTFTPGKEYVIPDGSSVHMITVTIKVPYTYQTQELVQLDNQYIPCKPIAGSSALEPYSQSVYTDVIRPKKISKTANVVDLILQGPTKADYTYRSGTDLDNKQLGLIIPIQFNFNDVSTVDLAGFGVNSILSEKWDSSAAYAAYGGFNVSSWFKQNSDIIGSGCGGGTWQTSDLLYWKCYKMPDYSDNYPRIYRIDRLFSNFSSVQNGLVIELKWNQKDHILPEGSVQSRTQLCQMACGLDVQVNNRGVYRTTVIINIWLEPFNAIVSPNPPAIEEDRLYVLVKKHTNFAFPSGTESEKNKYYVTFGYDCGADVWQFEKQGDDGLSEWYSTNAIRQTVAWDGTDNTTLGGFGIHYDDNWGEDRYVSGDKGLQSLFTNNNDLLEVILPNKVIGIGHLCFTGCQNLKKITFGSKLSAIYGDCFKNCTSLQQLDFTPCTESSLLTIGLRCFQNCTSMSKLILPKNKTVKIGQQTFENNSNMELEIQDGSWNSECGFNQIGYCGFKNCNKLCQTLDLGLCHTVGRYAFENCGSIKNIKVKWAPRPDLINGPVICHGAFKGCTNVEHFYSKNEPAVVHCCNIWYKQAINPQTAKLHVEASRYSQYANWAQFGDFATHGNLIGDLS